MTITPYQRFLRGLEAAQIDMNDVFNELRAHGEVMARQQNTLELDEDGFYYVTAAGPLEEVIPTVKKQLEKLERIKKAKDEAV